MHGRECEAVIVVETPYARALAEALEPDNRSTPPHVMVSCQGGEDKVSCRVMVRGCEEPRRILTLRNTIDDLLISAKAAVDVLEGSR